MPALWTTCRFTHSRPIPPPKRWRYIRARSSVQAKRMRQYVPIWYAFLVEHSRCAVFPNLPSVDVHHSRGRCGALLFATEFFIAVSRSGHQWIENHPAEAKARGFILPGGGAWNCFPPMHNYTPTNNDQLHHDASTICSDCHRINLDHRRTHGPANASPNGSASPQLASARG